MNKIKSFVKQIIYLITPPFLNFLREACQILVKKFLLLLKEKNLLNDEKDKTQTKKN